VCAQGSDTLLEIESRRDDLHIGAQPILLLLLFAICVKNLLVESFWARIHTGNQETASKQCHIVRCNLKSVRILAQSGGPHLL
jgi:hypothetical protein